jgi:hypothetical protein
MQKTGSFFLKFAAAPGIEEKVPKLLTCADFPAFEAV